MNKAFSEQFDRIFALADLGRDGEAIIALRRAREILAEDGISFGDLARAALARGFARSLRGAFFQKSDKKRIDARTGYLSKEVEELRAQLQAQDLQLGFWRRRAMDLENKTRLVSNESMHWERLASDTAHNLWDIGRAIGGEGLDSDGFLIETESLAAVKK